MLRLQFFVRFLLLFVVLFFVGCSTDNKELEKDLFLEVDSVRLGLSYIDSSVGFKFKIPKGWKDFTESYGKALNDVENQSEDTLVRQINGVYGSLNDKYFCFISDYNEFNDLEFVIKHVDKALTAGGTSKVKSGTFRHNGLVFNQWRILDSTNISFRLIFKTYKNKIVQIDYVIPNGQYLELIKNIEASIGSIKKTGEKNEKNS